MSDEPFIDAHVHHWDHAVEGLHWPWLEPGFSHRALSGTETLDAPRYTPPEFLAEAAGTGVAGMIHVQAVGAIADPALETAWLQRLADEHDLPSGIVGSCTVGAPDAVALLRRHAEHERFCGVRDIGASRHLDADEAAPVLDVLAEMGLSLEARRHHTELGVLGAIADRWPRLTVVLSHACLPVERDATTLDEWRRNAAALAGRTNVVCKISAVAGSSDPEWTVDGIRPWIMSCIEVFGADRCMFGGNWPVDRLFGSYHRLVDAYREIAAVLSPRERADVFHRTAIRVYGLESRPPYARRRPAG